MQLLKFIDRLHVISFHERAIGALPGVCGRACQFGTSILDVIITWTVGGCCELLEELEIGKGGSVDGWKPYQWMYSGRDPGLDVIS